MSDRVGHAVHEAGSSLDRRIRQVVEEVIAGSPIFLVDVQIRGNRGSRVVEIFVDSDDDLTVDDLARISRDIEFLLDTEDPIEGKYNLNVSSPGLDKPLSLPRQFRKNVGRVLRVHFAKPDESGNTEVVGTLTDADEEGIEITVSDDEVVHIAMGDVIWAKVQLPW